MSLSYHERQAKTGPNKICSLLLDYITNHISERVKELILSLCPPPPRPKQNHIVVRVFAMLAANGRFNKIFQYFPVRGHSSVPCDRDFGRIKNFYKKQIVCTRVISQTD
jgi:hypothetical protein